MKAGGTDTPRIRYSRITGAMTDNMQCGWGAFECRVVRR